MPVDFDESEKFDKTESTTAKGKRKAAATEDDIPMKDVSAVRSHRRAQTFSARSTANRHEQAVEELAPKDRADLHHMHEQWLKKERKQTSDDTSEKALQAVWQGASSASGTWTAVGRMVERKPESPMHVRKLLFFPDDPSTEAAFQDWGGEAKNTKGRKSEKDMAIGQDNCSVSMLPDGWEVYCVMDGHGLHGHWPSTRTVKTIPFFLQSTGCFTMVKQDHVEAALLQAYRKAQLDLDCAAFKSNIDIMTSGCTAVTCMYHPRKNKIWVANVGDSRAILIDKEKACVVYQSEDHKPNVPKERTRYEAQGMDFLSKTHDDGFVEERINFRGKNYPGIQMTRSLGDCAVKDFGIIAEPEVVEWSLDRCKNGAYLFIACDGVFDFIGSDDVAKIILSSFGEGESPKQACKRILKTARDAWEESEGGYCDDITMILTSVGGGSRHVSPKGNVSGGCIAGLQKSCVIS